MRILVTGAAGYIGSYLCGILCKYGHDVIGFDNLMYDQGTLVSRVFTKHKEVSRTSLGDDIWWDRCKLRRENILLWSDTLKRAIHSSDVIIPLAALVGAPLCDQEPQLARDLNHGWFVGLLDNIREDQLIIYPNTNSGYGSTGDQVCTEDTPSNPLSLYAKTKQDTEDLLLKNHDRTVCFRLATVFGWSYRPRIDLLVNNLVFEAKTNRHIEVFDGHFRRNYVYIKDVVEGFAYVVECHANGKDSNSVYPDLPQNEVYNLGNDSINMTKLDLVKKICSITNATYSIDETRSDPDKRDYLVSSEKLKKWGYSASTGLVRGIREMSGFYDLISRSDIEKCKNYTNNDYFQDSF